MRGFRQACLWVASTEHAQQQLPPRLTAQLLMMLALSSYSQGLLRQKTLQAAAAATVSAAGL
jgi:hypothetical protein